MIEKIAQSELVILFADILKGYSVVKDSPFGAIYVKHLSICDSAEVDVRYKYFYEQAKEKLPTQKIQEEFLHEQGFWLKSQTKDLQDLESFVTTLQKNKAQIAIPSHIDAINKQINDVQAKIFKLKVERHELLGNTAEAFAAKKANEFYIQNSMFRNKELSSLLLNEEDFDEINDTELNTLVVLYQKATENFSPLNLKRITISPFFMSIFDLCNDNAYEFYGKPIAYLSFYQSQLLSHGRYFRAILSNSQNQIPPDIMDDPDAIVDWHHASKNAAKTLENTEHLGGGKSLVGGTYKDYERLGIDRSEILDLSKEVAKKGGALNLQDMIKLHGIE